MIQDILSEKTILVTGGTGSIGSEIVKQLLTYDLNSLIIFSRDEIKQFMLKKKLGDSRVTTIIGDIRDYDSIQRIFDKSDIDIIYHASAMKHVVVCEDFPIECVKTNIVGTQNIVDLAKKYHVPTLITISTDKSASPVNVMGASKLIAEHITLNANYSCVRFGNVANSRGSVIPVFVENILQKKPLLITDSNVTRFLLEISDAVRLTLKATLYAKGGEIFILKMKAFKLGDLLDVICEQVVNRLDDSYRNLDINVIGLTSGEKLNEILINETEFSKLYEIEDMYVVLKDDSSNGIASSAKKVRVSSYSSETAELISKDKLAKIVNKYLDSNISRFDFNAPSK